jgi:hypothetical protein
MNRNAVGHLATSNRSLKALFGVFSVSLLAMLTVARDLPMVDLPQHAAQLTAWTHLSDPQYHGEEFELNLRTPYLLAYVIARVLACALPVVLAFKIVTWLCIVGTVGALYSLCRRLGHDVWLSLIGLPVALGYNFLYGFVSYLAAMPLVLVAIRVALDYAEGPTPKRGTTLALALMVLLAAHGIAFAQALLFVCPLLAFGRGTWAERIAPVLAAFVVAAAWLLPGHVGSRLGTDVWAASIQRFVVWPGLLVGAGSTDPIATWVGVLTIGCFLLALGRPIGAVGRWLPLTLTMLGFVAFPNVFRGYGPLWPRFVWLSIPGLLLAFGPGEPTRKRVSLRLASVLVVTLWITIFGWRLWRFQSEVEPWHRLAARLPPGLRLRAVVFEPFSSSFPGVPLLNHIPAYYYVEKGGMQGYSFAQYPASVVRFREDVPPRMTGGAEWAPHAFRFWAEADEYDCFVLQTRTQGRDDRFLGSSNLGFGRFARSGDWSAYCRLEPSEWPRASRRAQPD